MEIVDEWWREVDPQKKLEAPFGAVADLFVKKGIAPDGEFAKKILLKNIEKKKRVQKTAIKFCHRYGVKHQAPSSTIKISKISCYSPFKGRSA